MPSSEPYLLRQHRPVLLRLRLGTAVWALRQATNQSQSQLASRLRTSRQYISEVERGENLITVGTLYRLSKALRVSPVTLLRVARL